MKTLFIRLSLICALFLGVALPGTVQAAKGTPNSPDFGYGVEIDLGGKQVMESLPYASTLRVDWFSIDFDWLAHWPDSQQQPDLNLLDQVMQYAQQAKISVMLSISHAPGWAMTAQGPDSALTAWFVTNLAKRYPALAAVELFPKANTLDGWGAPPDPRLYVDLLKATNHALHSENLKLLVVAGGLKPLAAGSKAPNQDDLTFLQGLYEAGGLDQMPVISLYLDDLTGDPLQSPDQGERIEHRVLRHYEEIRQVMLANHHAAGLLWITHFSGPSGKIQASDAAFHGPQEQAVWLAQAYRLLRAQLYIGVAFYRQLNPPRNYAGELSSLIRSDTSHHPFYEVLGKIIAQNNQEFAVSPDFDQPQVKHITKNRG